MNNQENNFALIIGVGGPRIEYTVNDANSLQRNLTDPNLVGYPKDNVIVLKEKEATRAGILKAFDELKEKTNEDSTILLYYSGHGGREAEKHQFYLYPHDQEKLMAEDLKAKINALPSKKLVLFLDCCHAEGLVQTGLTGLSGMAQKLNDEQGIWIVASSQDNQESFGAGDNSFFTQALLEVLMGQHKRPEPFTDTEVSIMDVVDHIFETVPRNASQYLDEKTRKPCIQKPYFKTQMSEMLVLSYFPKNAENHEATIARLEPDVDSLDEDSFIELVRAMEAVGRIDDAVHTLKAHKRTKKDPDLLETLGNIYTNIYERSNKEKDGKRALKIFKKAYDFAVKTDDEEQVFTNAVKVAYMYAKLGHNEREMIHYAEVAKEAAEAYSIGDKTSKYLTLGEANIFLNNLYDAACNYGILKEKAKIKEKIKYYERAAFIYKHLFNPKDEEDAFIVFLKNTLLN